MLISTKKVFSVFLLLLVAVQVSVLGQVVTTSPAFPTADEPVTLTFDLTQASDTRAEGLLGKTDDVYIWAGAGTTVDGDAFEFQPPGQTNWQQPFEPGKLTYLGDDRWEITLVPREYFDVPADQPIRRLGLVVKNGSGTAQTEDLFVRVYPDELEAEFRNPTEELLFTEANAAIPIEAASSKNATLSLLQDGEVLTSVSDATSLEYSLTPNGEPGVRHEVILKAETATATAADTFYYIIEPEPAVAALPAGVEDGVNYVGPDEVILSLFAPDKEFVYVIGEFNDWLPSEEYLLNRTPDGERYWIRLDGLPVGEEVAYQYLVDGEIVVADPYTEKILDPNNDQYLTAANYPGLKPYPEGATGIVSVLQTDQEPYGWQVDDFERPDADNLVIYELLVRDFLDSRNYETLADTLTYLKRLGVNAIELMPVTEFSGNDSWGYNPTFFFAPDKAYGAENQLKAFIDKAHEMGIAVILDIVLNQADYENPYVKLYWDGDRPAANSPFFNQEATHPFSVFFDFNHESPATQAFVERVTEYWLEEYNFDGFRFDLSKGFTQNQTSSVEAWSAYDPSRVNILKGIYDDIRTYDPDAYLILEHFADNQEETELADYGFMLWGNANHDFRALARGDEADPSWISYQERGWDEPQVIGYIESHDEERLLYDVLENGESSGTYDTQDLTTALNRSKLAAAFALLVPGPKMLWQFGELGYDVSIDHNGRTGAKPVLWEYQQDPERQKLYNVYAALINLKLSQPVFQTDDFNLDYDDPVKRLTLQGEDNTVFVVGNFDVETRTVPANFPREGTWYDYFSGEELSVTNPTEDFVLQPGEFHLFSTAPLPAPQEGLVPWSNSVLSVEEEIAAGKSLVVYPNPTPDDAVVSLTGDYRGSVYVNVLDATGRVLHKLELQKSQQSLRHQLLLQDLAAGLYYLQVEIGSQRSVRKLVKVSR
ncbi:putative secreted protein (Por secretion system target) [Pontibacter ummariensis]|uniref:Por secretion system C-terminal sorting domain-containing protein n=1 Tax=Pontibacter ummariensis TaxID=1610492 RepID=A0A239I7H3_9BACT|nr:alpha-amylase family glycosyl hydrolase [Pontibacter ummariensis]PRY10008.1 putative secreted protein (Por secretion system target) [Pontibacter ummariensis]SNS89431.1 Por secretion system C-terminal sorting domain-containing protein [Pontibacter ummariensis]